jgi:hypothetical protein
MREQRAKLSQKLWSMKPREIVEYFGKKVKMENSLQGGF